MNAHSYGSLNTYQRCPKKYEYTYVYDLQPKKRSQTLFDGINAHKFLQTFFLSIQAGLSTTDAWSEVEDASVLLYADGAQGMFAEEAESLSERIEEALSWVRGYCAQYGEEWEVLHVEEEFVLILDSGAVISFTPDLVVRDRTESVWVVDHKTTARLPESGIPFGDMQALLYYSGIQNMYPETVGFIFNRIRKKLPTQPRLTKTGKKRVADLKRIDTTYEVLKNFLKENAPELLGDIDHQQRLAYLRDEPDKFFWTEQVYVNAQTTKAILEDTAAIVTMIENDHQFVRNLQEDNGYKSCSKCPFNRLCMAQLYGWDAETVIEEDYEPREHKNPYEEETNDED